jgi:lipocalin-like protein
VTDGAPLVGGWRLRSWVALGDDGSETLPMGDAPTGLLAYTGGGTMVALMAPDGRPSFGSDDLTGGTPDEQARAFSSFVAYAGRYRIEGDTIIHTVETSLFPNWVGTVQRRRWTLSEDGGTLTLESPPLALRGVTRRQRLTWTRVDEAS